MTKFVKAIFCPPTGAYDNLSCPSRLTDDVFSALKEIGINRIFGFGYDARTETRTKIFELCEKYDIGYFPTLDSFGDYIALSKKNGKTFNEMNEEEISSLDNRMVEEIKAYLPYRSFKGVFFGDEAGYLSFDGLAHAKRVFSEHFPDLEFHFNLFSYSINEPIFWGGMELSRNPNIPYRKPFELDKEHQITFENRFRFYDLLTDHLLKQTKFEFVSQDKYPFEPFWKEVPSSVHVALFELNAYFAAKKKQYGFSYYNYLQAGQWSDSKNRKHLSKGEMLLQTNVTIGYGHQGYAYFPGCFPIDFLFDPVAKEARNGAAGLIDINGLRGEIYPWVKEEAAFVSLIEEELLSSEFLGVWGYGKYDNGFSAPYIDSLPDNECIFRGELPMMARYKSPGIDVKSSNEVMVSSFKKGSHTNFFITNLTSLFPNDLEIRLPEKGYVLIHGDNQKSIEQKLQLRLEPGEAIYLKKL